MSININMWSKVALAFAAGVSLSAGYVALGMQANASAPTVIVEERCGEQAQAIQAPEAAQAPDPYAELVRDPPYYGQNKGRLEAMAKKCELRDDHPLDLDETFAKALGLNVDERDAWKRAKAAMVGKEGAMHFILLKEIDEDLDISTMKVDEQRHTLAERIGETKRPEDRSLYRDIAEERAGMKQAPTKKELREHSAWARYTRWQLTQGDMFAAELAKDLGEERVDELRRTFNGWPGDGGTARYGCEDDPEDLIEGYDVNNEQGLDKAIIRRIVRAHIGEIRRCYNQGLTRDPRLAGRVAVNFTVGGDGKVTRSEVTGDSTLGDAQVEQCIADAVLTWRFPRPKDDGNVIITYPFVLEPG